MTSEIRRSKKGPYWTLTVDGEEIGNYDTFKEATDDLEEIIREKSEVKTA